MSIEGGLRDKFAAMSSDVPGGPSLQRAIQQGRARRRRRAVAAVGSGVATVCAVGVVAGAVMTGVGPFNGDDGQRDEDAKWAVSVPPEAVPHAIEDAVRAQLPDGTEITYKELDAYGKGSRPLPKERWDEATSWYGTFMLGAEEQVSVELLHSKGETEGDPDKLCGDPLYKRCDANDVAGVQVFNWEWALRNDGRPGAKSPGPWGAMRVDQIKPDRRWFEQTLEAQPGGDYLVRAKNTIKARTFEQARGQWTLDTESLRAIAMNGDFLEDPTDG